MSEPNRDLTELVERLPALEERLGVRFEALHATAKDMEHVGGGHIVSVRGEVHCETGMEIENDIQLVISSYDDSGRLVAKESDYIDCRTFYAFHSFEASWFSETGVPSRIRVHPVGEA